MPYDIRAYLALLAFVPLSLLVFAAVPRHRVVASVFGVYMGGLLFLPEAAAFDFPLVPPLDKNSFAAIMALTGAFIFERKRLIQAKPFRGVDIFFLIVIAGDIGTALTNPDVLIFGEERFSPDGYQYGFRVVLESLRPYDIISMAIRDVLSTYIPFFLGRALFRSTDQAETFLKGVVIACLIYVPFMLIEMRLSPQFHNWTYGFTPNKFLHAMRGSGFKPTVYLNNGLAVAMLFVAGSISAAILFKRRASIMGMPMIIPFAVIWLMLALSRNVGATVYSLVAVPVVLMSRGRLAAFVGIVLGIAVFVYPYVRANDIIDVYEIIDWIAERSAERAQSLHTRFYNEDILWDRASERPWYGWGGYGRNRIYDTLGKDISITDGEWIIRIGGRGIVGFIGTFIMLVAPVFMAFRRMGKMAPEDRRIVDGMALLVALNAVDLLPNALFTQWPFLFAGALAGMAQSMPRTSRSS